MYHSYPGDKSLTHTPQLDMSPAGGWGYEHTLARVVPTLSVCSRLRGQCICKQLVQGFGSLALQNQEWLEGRVGVHPPAVVVILCTIGV